MRSFKLETDANIGIGMNFLGDAPAYFTADSPMRKQNEKRRLRGIRTGFFEIVFCLYFTGLTNCVYRENKQFETLGLHR